MFRKLVISFLIIILVLTTMMTVTIAGYSDSIQSQDMLDAFRISADSITKRCNSYIMRVQDDMLTLAVDQTFQLHLQAFRFEGALSDSLSVPQSATSQFSVYPMRGGLLYAQTEDGTYKVAPLLQQQDWIQETIGRGGRLHLTAIEQNGTQYIRFSMLVTDMSNWTSALAVLAADVPMDSFVLYIGKNNLGSSGSMFLCDSAAQIQYPYQLPAAVSEEYLHPAIDCGTGSLAHYNFICSPISHTNWQMILLFSTQGIHERTLALYKQVLFCAIGAFLCSMFFAMFFSYQHAKPILHLVQHIRNPQYLYPIDVPKKLNRDYLALYTSYNTMVEQANTLLEELYETNKRERETQLKMLQAQLNPHFIYNVLDSISWMARKYQAADIEMIVCSLATMLRCSLNSGRDILTVYQEIRQVQSYLTIQSYRYDNAIHVTYEFAPEIMEKKMVKLLLQPLVENAIIHGLETFSGKKCLRIRGYLDKQLLVFEIENNGKIPDLDRIRKILSGQQQITKSYGIWNVNERIKAAYGARYGLRYYQREDWVVANITIPAEPMY